VAVDQQPRRLFIINHHRLQQDIDQRQQTLEQLEQYRDQLEQQLEQQRAQLTKANEQLGQRGTECERAEQKLREYQSYHLLSFEIADIYRKTQISISFTKPELYR